MVSSKLVNAFNASKLTVLEELDKGGFGCVFNATYENSPVVVKSSLVEEKDESMIREYKHLLRLQSGKFSGIPKISYSFLCDGKESFMMEKLGTDLLKLLGKTTDKKFSLETTLMIALQVLKRLESVHSCGIIHNDIKPNNLMTGFLDPNTIYLIDFGVASSYIDEGEHTPCTKTSKLRGTKKYCSVNAMRGRSVSRRDDLESLAYVLVRLNSGKLPWDTVLKDETKDKKAMLKETIKCKRLPASEICEGTCKEFEIFLDEVRSLGFYEKPAYDKYYKMFEKLLNQRGVKADSEFVWD